MDISNSIAHATDQELGEALNFLDAQSTYFEGSELRAWNAVRDMVMRRVCEARAIAAEDADVQNMSQAQFDQYIAGGSK